ncbi:MAG: hypothetical protein SGJ23_15165, partial [Alphaproteobacteria bacterium]|nr:hypothetical protein [Alphaproteobacteria bacterium]
MIFDALKAEFFKLSRDRTLLFWCVLAPALAHIVVGVALELAVRGSVSGAASLARPNVALEAVLSVGAPANPFVAGFLAAAAAIVIAGEYRWTTWRLIAPRNDRAAILVGKYGALLALALASVALFAINGVVIAFLSAFVNAMPREAIAGGVASGLSGVALGALSALLHVAFVIGLVAVGAIATRSLLVSALVAAVGMIVLEGGVALIAQDNPGAARLLPVGAAGEVRQYARALAGDEDAEGAGGLGA